MFGGYVPRPVNGLTANLKRLAEASTLFQYLRDIYTVQIYKTVSDRFRAKMCVTHGRDECYIDAS